MAPSTLWLNLIIIGLIFLVKNLRVIEGCTCQLAHPQAHYCSSHYVILARIRNSTTNEHNVYYNIKLNKAFKLNDEASSVLQNSKAVVHTARYDSLCGIQLEKGKTYLLAGRVIHNGLRVSTCDFHQEWKTLTVKQKKGFKLLYNKGCNCKVVPCPWWNIRNCKQTPAEKACYWETYQDDQFDCQGSESICMKQTDGLCGWNRSMKFRHCLKRRQEHKKRQRELEP